MNFNEFCRRFRLGEWREENQYRREYERAIILHAIDTDAEIERLLSHWQTAARYNDMNFHDRASFRQRKCGARRIAKFWHLLQADEQTQFRSGAMLPYRAAKIIRDRLKRGSSLS